MNQIMMKLQIMSHRHIIYIILILTFAILFSQCKSRKEIPSRHTVNEEKIMGKWQLHSLGNIMPAFGYVFEINTLSNGKIEDDGKYINFEFEMNNNNISFRSEDKRAEDFPFMDGEIFEYHIDSVATSIFLQLIDKNNREVAQYVKIR